MTAMEIIYNPLETKFVQAARAKGCLTINGLEMFIRQGAEQFRLWTGLEPPLEVMRRAVLQALS
jgi:shikimate dehydrogenase